MADVCFSTSSQTTSIAYSATTNTPASYSIDWNAAANAAGLADQNSTNFSFIAAGGTLTGITVTASTPSNTYSGTMTIKNANGCTNTQSVSITINPLPTITTAGSAAGICISSNSQTTSLTYSATTNSPTSYSIDWNAAANAAGLADQGSTSFSFAAGGGTLTGIVVSASTPSNTYSGTMTLTNSNGCINSKSVSVTVNPLPTITSGNASDICFSTSSQTTSLIYSATTNSPTSYSIDWNAAANSAGLADQGSTSFSFAAGGGTLTGIVISASTPSNTYSGTMTLTNANGCNNTKNISVSINPLPTISTGGTLSSLCFNKVAQTTTLTYSAATNSPTSYSIDWNAAANAAGLSDQGSTSFSFTGGGGTLTSIVVTASTPANTYTGTIILKNGNTCSSNGTNISFTIHPKPVAAFTIDSTQNCLKSLGDTNLIKFNDISTVATGYNSRLWTLGDSKTDTNKNIANKMYASSGMYTVTLYTTSDKGCKHDTSHTIYIKPTAGLTLTNNPPTDSICYKGNSNIALKHFNTYAVDSTFFNWNRTNIVKLNGTSSNSSISGPNNTINISLENLTSVNQVTQFNIIPYKKYKNSTTCIGDTVKTKILVYPYNGFKSNRGTRPSFICSTDSMNTFAYTDSVTGAVITSKFKVTRFLSNLVTTPLPTSTNKIIQGALINNPDSGVGLFTYTANSLFSPKNCTANTTIDSFFVIPHPVVNPSTKSQAIASGDITKKVKFNTNTRDFDNDPTFKIAGNTYYTYTATSKYSSKGFNASGTIAAGKFFNTLTLTNDSEYIDTIQYKVVPHFQFKYPDTGNPYINTTCTGDIFTYYIIVLPKAKVIVPTDTAICDGELIPAIAWNTNIKGAVTTYAWVVKGEDTDIDFSPQPVKGSGNVVPFKVRNKSISTKYIEFTIIPSSYNIKDTTTKSIGISNTYKVWIHPTPHMQRIKDDSLCSGIKTNTIDFIKTATSGTTLYKWDIVWKSAQIPTGIPSGITDSIPGQILNNTSTLDGDTGSVLYRIIPSYISTLHPASHACISDIVYSYKHIIKPLPPIPIISDSANSKLCGGVTGVNYSIINDPTKRYLWTSTPNTDIRGADNYNCYVNLINNSTSKYTIDVRSLNVHGCYQHDISILNIDTSTTVPHAKIKYLPKTDILLCLNNDVDSYQWGCDSIPSLKSVELTGEVFQEYVPARGVIDTTRFLYWVRICKSGCCAKSYLYQLGHLISGITNQDIVDDLNINVFPNPTQTGQFFISVPDVVVGNVQLNIYDITGRLVVPTKTINVSANNLIEVNQMVKGTYIVTVISNEKIYRSKIIVQ